MVFAMKRFVGMRATMQGDKQKERVVIKKRRGDLYLFLHYTMLFSGL